MGRRGGAHDGSQALAHKPVRGSKGLWFDPPALSVEGAVVQGINDPVDDALDARPGRQRGFRCTARHVVIRREAEVVRVPNAVDKFVQHHEVAALEVTLQELSIGLKWRITTGVEVTGLKGAQAAAHEPKGILIEPKPKVKP